MSSIKSPCRNNCELNPDKVCIACRRTLIEIKDWPFYDDTQKQIIIDRVNRTDKDFSLLNREMYGLMN